VLGSIRRKGAGRKPLTQTNPTFLRDLEGLVDPGTRGDPVSPLKWTTKSLRNLAGALGAMGHSVGRDVVGDLLKTLGYSLEANRKTFEGSGPVDRDAQFGRIAEAAKTSSRPISRPSASIRRRRNSSAPSRTTDARPTSSIQIKAASSRAPSSSASCRRTKLQLGREPINRLPRAPVF